MIDLALRSEIGDWNAIKGSQNEAAVDDYLRRWPNGQFVEAARLKLDRIRRQQPLHLDERTNAKDRIRYVHIPAGTFRMGCSPMDETCRKDEKPAHEVNITEPFWLAQTETTVGAYLQFTKATRHPMPKAPSFNSKWTDLYQPIVNVSSGDAKAFCSWVDGRLPSEAEWEYAARAGAATSRYGSLDDIAWYAGNSTLRAHPVGHKTPNGFGLFDMLGNVWEWVTYSNASEPVKGTGVEVPRERLIGDQHPGVRVRGGSWRNEPDFVRVSERGSQIRSTANTSNFSLFRKRLKITGN